MPFLRWNSDLETNIKKIDDQHKKLVQLINDLFDAMNAGKSKEALGGILHELVEYTKMHFATEESFFKLHHYPDSIKHQKEHNDLATQVLEFQKQFNEGNARVTVQLMNFLKDWITNHILGSDKKYGPFLISKGVK
jgi:hemerythrin